jgi:HAD superfamily phosphatase (TIGR01668 family)
MIEWLTKKSYFIPDDYQKTVFDIDYDRLAASGVKTLLIDLDNTLLPYDVSDPDELTVSLFDVLRTKGFRIVVISNNHEPRVKHYAALVKCPYVFGARKPFAGGFKKGARLAGTVNPLEVCVIGDQFMTDVWGGKRLGYRVIVVDALKRSTEKWFTKMNRKMEKRVISRIRKENPELYDQLHLAEKR